MKTIHESKSHFFNSDGWRGETLTTVNNQTFQIFSSKRGNYLKSDAYPCEAQENERGRSLTFSLGMMANKSIDLLVESKGRVTESAIKEHHYKAIAIFDRMVSDGKIQAEEKEFPKVGTILFLDGYGKIKGSDENEHIVYKIEGNSLFTVERTTLELNEYSHVRNYKDQFGIGIYFIPSYKFEGSEETINNLVLDAINLQSEQHLTNELLKMQNEEERERKIEEGKKIVKIPSWAKSIIVADLYQDNSESQTDYFSTTVSQTVYLAFSKSTRNNMAELKKAALHFEGTKEFPQDEEVQEYTYGHSYLPDYFYGTKSWSGYKIIKNKYFDFSNPRDLEALYIAAADGLYMISDVSIEENNKSEASTQIEYVDYSEKAFAIIGDTKPVKDVLKDLGGRFNPRLTCGAGWIFSKRVEDKVKKELNIN